MRSTPLLFRGALLIWVLLLGACGGGDARLGGGSPTPDPTVPVPASLTLLLSSPQLSSDASAVTAGVTLTAIVKDSNNNVVPNQVVQFATQDSAEINVSNPATTDENGRVTAILTTGGDQQNRTITVTASVIGDEGPVLTKSAQVEVIGTTLDISGQDNTQINVETDYTILLTDASGSGIAGKTVEVTAQGGTVAAESLVTDAAGQVVVAFRPNAAQATLTASALGLTTAKEIVVSTDEFVFTDPAPQGRDDPPPEVVLDNVRTITVRWRQLQNGQLVPVPDGTPIKISATRGQVSPSDITTEDGFATTFISSNEAGFSEIVATSTALSRPTSRLVLEFVATNPSRISVQGSPTNMVVNQTAEITAVVRDPDNNLVKNATVDFRLTDLTGGTLSSPFAVTNSQGLARVNYQATSQASETDGVVVTGSVRGTSEPVEDSAVLTVGARAVSISIGTGAELVSKDLSTYQQPWTVLVSDSSGNPVSDAEFTLSVRSLTYIKGTRSGGATAVCINEDLNLNDLLDPGEDADGDDLLDPGRVASVPNTVELDEDGTAQFFLTYPKDFGQFARVEIVGTARVAGTETTERRSFFLGVTVDDAPFLPNESPFGVIGEGDLDPFNEFDDPNNPLNRAGPDPGCFIDG